MNHRLIACPCLMQVGEGDNNLPRKIQPACSFPCCVACSFLDTGCGGVHYREEEHLARVSRCVLIGIKNPRCPGVKLQTMECFIFPLSLGLQILLCARGQIIKVQDYPILSCGMTPLVDAMETLFFRRLEFQ